MALGDALIFLSFGLIALGFAVQVARKKQCVFLFFLLPPVSLAIFFAAHAAEMLIEQESYGYLLTIFALSGIIGVVGVINAIRAVRREKQERAFLIVGTLLAWSPFLLMVLGK